MSIFNHFKHLNLSPGQENALSMLESFLNGPIQVFLLKGYAGSGKTTLLKGLIEFVDHNNKLFYVMAPTGRAAKVLRDKTGYGMTIHKSIYNFEKLESIKMESDDDAEHSFHYYFPINELNNDGHIIIVDESSMISNKLSQHELFTFGTNILLEDLLTFSRLTTSKNKIIFVGDPAQLPPVSDSKSLALDKSFFDNLGIGVEETELTEVLRQGNNLILSNAKHLRALLLTPKRNTLNFEFDNSSFIKISATEIIEKYCELFPKPEIGCGIIIAFSNGQCYQYNMAIRSKLFPGQLDINSGDLILINNNNYHTYGTELFNGDIAKVIHVNAELVSQSAPVYCEEGGKKVRKIITFQFRKIAIRIPTFPEDINCYIIDSLLHSINRDLSICEMKALYINFVMRFKEEQNSRRASNLPYFRIGSEEFKLALKSDPFFNALKVKFGYSITCHKAQGGEWDKVFIDYSGRISLKDEPLRWCYTATTRGVNVDYVINAPHFGSFTNLRFSPVGTIGTIPKDSLSFEMVALSPFHTVSQHKCKSSKYWELLEKFEATDYRIEKVESFGDYLERYTLSHIGETIELQASHKGSGHFVEQFKVISNTSPIIKSEIENILCADSKTKFTINFMPPAEFLEQLHSRIQDICEEEGVNITNIVYEPKSYYVTYYLRTDSICSYIQFYFNNNDQLTTANPKTFQCAQDLKLQNIINKLSLHDQ